MHLKQARSRKHGIETAIGSLAYGPLAHPFLIVGEQE
jgi:hypothetical protein